MALEEKKDSENGGLYDVQQHLRIMGIKGWKETTQRRDDQRKIVEEAKSHNGLQIHRVDRYEYVIYGYINLLS